MNCVPHLADSYARTSLPFALVKMSKDLQFGQAKDKNFVFSPCSIQLALGLMASGTTGETLKELLSFLESENLECLKLVAAKQVDSLTGINSKGGSDLSFVGGVWVDQSCRLKPQFKADAEKIYKVMKFESVDFQDATKREEVIVKVNEWCKEATKGLIDSILPKNSLTKRTRTVLANALYFKGVWSEKFDPSLTKEAKFRLRDGETVQVPYMRIHKYDYRYIDSYNDFQVLRLPYENSSISMYIILPKRSKTGGLWSLVEKIGSDPSFIQKYIHTNIKCVRVGKFLLPKFKTTYDFKAKEILQNAGIELLFTDYAELSEMIYERRKVNEVHHKSYIEVYEEGTEAAAVTEVDDDLAIALFDDPTPLPPPVDFVADHAFMYMVTDDQSGMVLFMGHIVNPLLE